MSPRRTPLTAALAWFVLTGCGSSTHETVRSLGAADLDCPTNATTPWVVDVGHDDVRGCGRHREYRCELERSGIACTPLGEVTPTPPRSVGWRALTPQSKLEAELGPMTPELLACRRGATRMEIPYRVLAGKSSVGIRSDGGSAELKEPEAKCVIDALSKRKIYDKVPPLEQEDHAKRAYTFSAQSVAVPPPEAPAPAATRAPPPRAAPTAEAPSAAPPPAPEDETDARVRALVAENSEAIKACAGTDLVAVEARYDESGKVFVTLRGDQRDSPVGRCVDTIDKNSLELVQGDFVGRKLDERFSDARFKARFRGTLLTSR